MAESEAMRTAFPIMGIAPRIEQLLVLVGHVRHALWVQVLDKGFYGVGCLNRPISLDRFLDLSDLLEIQ